jgi:hypothetical protein
MQFLNRDGTLSQLGQPTDRGDRVGADGRWLAQRSSFADDLFARVQGFTWAVLHQPSTPTREQHVVTHNVGSSNNFVVCCS